MVWCDIAFMVLVLFFSFFFVKLQHQVHKVQYEAVVVYRLSMNQLCELRLMLINH